MSTPFFLARHGSYELDSGNDNGSVGGVAVPGHAGDAPGAGPAVSRAAMRGLGEALGALDDRLRRLEARADRLS